MIDGLAHRYSRHLITQPRGRRGRRGRRPTVG
jgi:hypothetical protein